MSHSSSGLRGVTLNDLFVVTAKRATDMRSLAEAASAKHVVEKPRSTWFYLTNILLDASLYSSLAALEFTLSDALLRFHGQDIEFLNTLILEQGTETARLVVAAAFTLTAFTILNVAAREALSAMLPYRPAALPLPEAGYVARAILPRSAISLGPLKVSYAIAPDALVVRSLKDHAVTVISMEMISRAILGDADSLFGNPPSDTDGASEIRQLGIGARVLRSWYGPKHTCPVVISLKSGDKRVPLFIHGMYFDGQASAEGANETFVREFNSALDAFRKSQAGHGDHGHDDHGHGHGGHGGGHH